jgi:DNA-binding transcriptional LysR family regulator
MCWLIPRMPSFYAKNPDVEIKLDMNYDRVDFTRDNISVAIRNSTIELPRSAIIRPHGHRVDRARMLPELSRICPAEASRRSFTRQNAGDQDAPSGLERLARRDR